MRTTLWARGEGESGVYSGDLGRGADPTPMLRNVRSATMSERPLLKTKTSNTPSR